MNEPPDDVDLDELLRLARRSWDPAAEALEYLAVGFGAHHWRVLIGGEPRYFLTLDDLGVRHSVETLRAAYHGAAALAALGLEFVVAPQPPYGVMFGQRAVSLTRWVSGEPVQAIDHDVTGELLRRLHAVDPSELGEETPQWQPVVGRAFVAHLADRLTVPWSGGPYGERSRRAIRSALTDIERWADRYAELGLVARTRSWVPTHGEPGWHNQMITAEATVIVDWETLRLAPAERDLQTLAIGNSRMLELFDLEWRLDEINQYAAWFAGSHGDSADDRTAFEGLIHELTR